MKLITLPLRDFAVPAPLGGSIRLHSGYGRAALEGREIHTRIQRQRRAADAAYRCEAPVSCLLEREGFGFRIDGRMDGFSPGDPPLIEEIKSAFTIRELARTLAEAPLDHPYSLQLLSYGYFLWREQGVLPRLRFVLVSTRNRASEELELLLDIPLYERWLEVRLAELVQQARLAEKRAVRRRRAAASLTFPFPAPRSGQDLLMEYIEERLAEGRSMLIQAPTGLGKTVGVLYPVLREALGRGNGVVYLTPKNSQHAVAEEGVAAFRRGGAALRSLTITARGKICPREEPLCSPDGCPYARGYYDRFRQHDVAALLARKRSLGARAFRRLGEEFTLCPYELQLDAAADADIVICDYNYLFSPRSSLGLSGLAVDRRGKPLLVIDEAHNLPARSLEYHSPALSSAMLEELRGALERLSPPLAAEALGMLDACQGIIAGCGGGAPGGACIEPPLERFLEQDERLRAFLARYLEAGGEPERGDGVLKLSLYWSDFCQALQGAADPERDEFFTTWYPQGTGGTLKITCCDASAMLRENFTEYELVVAFSATLKPFDYYARLSGLESGGVASAEFPSPFPRGNRKLLLIPQVSTRYSRRERNYGRIAEVVRRVTEVRAGNYLVFLPSFRFLERVSALFRPPDGFVALNQERNMTAERLRGLLEHLRSRRQPTVVFAVQGGSLSEGIDYAGEMLLGAFVVGPPLPTYDFEREQMRAYYQRRYGAGFEYAYGIPAMARAVQAAGRVIRSETDRGLIVLMDDRFLEETYRRAMPADWFERDLSELVSTSILADVGAFWEGRGGELPAPEPAEEPVPASTPLLPDWGERGVRV